MLHWSDDKFRTNYCSARISVSYSPLPHFLTPSGSKVRKRWRSQLRSYLTYKPLLEHDREYVVGGMKQLLRWDSPVASEIKLDLDVDWAASTQVSCMWQISNWFQLLAISGRLAAVTRPRSASTTSDLESAETGDIYSDIYELWFFISALDINIEQIMYLLNEISDWTIYNWLRGWTPEKREKLLFLKMKYQIIFYKSQYSFLRRK